MRILILLLTLMRIRILPLTFLPDLDPPMLRNDPLGLPLFHFDADPDSALQFDADPDPASCSLYGQNSRLIAKKVICKLAFLPDIWMSSGVEMTDNVHVQGVAGMLQMKASGIRATFNTQMLVKNQKIFFFNFGTNLDRNRWCFLFTQIWKKEMRKAIFWYFRNSWKKTQIISHIHYIKIFHLPSLLNFQFSRSVAVWYGSRSCSFFSFQDANKKYISFFADFYW